MEKMERMLTQRPMMKCGCSGGNNTRFFHGTKVNCIMATRCLRKSVQSVITVRDNEMAMNNGFRHSFNKGRKMAEAINNHITSCTRQSRDRISEATD